MEFNMVKVERYGRKVYEHTEMDELRKTQCMCLNCANLVVGSLDNCEVAEANFQTCVTHGLAVAVTRCPLFVRKIK